MFSKISSGTFIPDPVSGSRGQKAPDTGSATLISTYIFYYTVPLFVSVPELYSSAYMIRKNVFLVSAWGFFLRIILCSETVTCLIFLSSLKSRSRYR